MEHVKKELRKRKKKPPRYESYGLINTTSTPVYRPESPNRLAVGPQETLRPPPRLQNTDEGHVGAPIHRLVSADHLSDHSSDTLDDNLGSGGDEENGPLVTLDRHLAWYEEDNSQERSEVALDEDSGLQSNVEVFGHKLEESVLEGTDMQDEYPLIEVDRSSICSLNYVVQATGQGPQRGKSVPDDADSRRICL